MWQGVSVAEQDISGVFLNAGEVSLETEGLKKSIKLYIFLLFMSLFGSIVNLGYILQT